MCDVFSSTGNTRSFLLLFLFTNAPLPTLVCKKMVNRFIDTAKARSIELSDQKAVQGIIRELCKDIKNNRENRFVSIDRFGNSKSGREKDKRHGP